MAGGFPLVPNQVARVVSYALMVAGLAGIERDEFETDRTFPVLSETSALWGDVTRMPSTRRATPRRR